MKKIKIAAAATVALMANAYAEADKKGDVWVGGFLEYYGVDDSKPTAEESFDNGNGVGAEIGYRFADNWATRLELSFLDVGALSNNSGTGNRFGIDAMYFFNQDSFYAFGGFKVEDIGNTQFDLGNLGVGKHWHLDDRFRVITEAAVYYDLHDNIEDYGFKLGLAYRFGSGGTAAPSVKDSDNDGVKDSVDQCPTTPYGIKVDAKGCSLDTDGDGVKDNVDNCPNTPAGVSVDSYGCNDDFDGDGVVNAADKCPDTPAGTAVGVKGCSLALDSDQDGVLDDKDQCADTPVTDKVDDMGCSLFTEEEVSVNLQVLFDNNSSVVSSSNDEQFKEFADFMNRYPSVDAVIEGHASAPGNADYNMNISQQRADSVRTLLIENYGLDAERLTAKGFGETQLLDDSNTAEAHKVNRRITAKVSASKRVKVQK